MGHTRFPWLSITFFYHEEYLRPLSLSGFRILGYMWMVNITEIFPLNSSPFNGTGFASELVVLRGIVN